MEEKDTKKNTSQGKGKGKNKKQTMDLNEFMASNPTQVGFTAVATSRWSDLMDGEEEDDSLFNKMNDTVVILPNAPKSIRGPDIDINQIPTEPPFICYLSNLPFEVTEDDIYKFFKDLKITRIELAKEQGSTGRMRGQGTCTFPDRKTLIDAFTCNKGTIKNREIKLSINSFETERENYRRERYNDKEDRTGGDWRARQPEDKPISSYSSNQSYNESNYNRNRDRGDRDYNRFNGDSYGGSGNYNNRSNRMNRDYDKDKYPSQLQDSNKNRSQFLTNFLSKNVEIKQDYKKEDLEISEIDRQTKNITINSNEPGYDNKFSDQKREEEPRRERKKLVLLPPSKKENTEPSTPATNSSIFGEAKPVDTSKRLLEVETKLQEKVVENKEKESEKSSRENVSKSNYNKRLSDSGSQSGSSYRDNSFDNRNSGRYEDDRFSNNFRKGGNQNRRMNSGNRNYDNFNNRDNNRDNYNRDNRNNRDNRDNRDSRNLNKFNNNGGYRNNSRDNDQSNKPVIKKDYDNRNRQNRNTDGNRMARGRNENIFSNNRYELLEESNLD